MRRFEVAERRARLARRHHLSPAHRAPDVVAAADGVVCLHGTDPATVYLSSWARVDRLTVADVDRALYSDRALIKHLAMRRTLFVLGRELFPVVQSAASFRVADQQTRQLIRDIEKAGIAHDGAAWLRAASAATLDALDSLGEATAAELRGAVPELAGSIVYAADKPYGGPAAVAPRVLTTLSAAGRILRTSNRGGWTTSRPAWSLTERWLGAEPLLPPPAEARVGLVRRWLHAFGPATVADVKWWLGSTLTDVRAALPGAGAIEVDLDGRPGVALADDLDPVGPVEPSAALLPGLDPTTMGWAERDWYLGEHRSRIFDGNGNAGTSAWWDGHIVGGWTQAPDGEVVLHLLEDVGHEATTALAERASRLGEWLGGVRIAPRFPSPLTRAAGTRSAP